MGGEWGYKGGIPEVRGGPISCIWARDVRVGLLGPKECEQPLELRMDDQQWLHFLVDHVHLKKFIVDPCKSNY